MLLNIFIILLFSVVIYAIQYRHKLQKQISTEQKQAKNKRLMHLSNNRK
jgi:hypothetical protein